MDFWATVDKAMPSHTTNQAVLVVAQNQACIPCPISVAAPKVYTELECMTLWRNFWLNPLKDKSFNQINHISKDVLSRLCGIATDRLPERLLQELGIEDSKNDQLSSPITWDAAPLINLGLVAVKDQSPSSNNFKTFVKRCNVFNTIRANGEGFTFLQLVDKDARQLVAHATRRLTSSFYKQWLKIEKSFSALWKAFDICCIGIDQKMKSTSTWLLDQILYLTF